MKLLTIILGALVLSNALVTAQQRERRDGDRPRPPEQMRDGERPRPFLRGPDRMMQDLFPPPLIFQAGEELGLTEEQRNAIREELDKSRERFEPVQDKLREQMESLSKLLREPRVSEAMALAQLDKVLATENEIKKAQLTSLIRVNNVLTPEQKEKLQNFIKAHRPPGPPEGEPGARPPFGRERDGERKRPPQEPPPNR
ncbi:MAG: hypothetical protein FJ395_04400 [Verrucomicrobia bacterium]|nr:hypothetical protein [Verrucomicrobiota bacterium]